MNCEPLGAKCVQCLTDSVMDVLKTSHRKRRDGKKCVLST